jgi:C1A family cysteine protease
VNGEKMNKQFKFGYIPSKISPSAVRNLSKTELNFDLVKTPLSFDISKKAPPILDQGNLGSCVWNAIANILFYLEKIQGNYDSTLPSRLFGYYLTRARERTLKEDAGCQPLTAINVACSDGCCVEREWPYIINKFTTKPNNNCYVHAKNRKLIDRTYLMNGITQYKKCISLGYPVLAGILVWSNFISDYTLSTGIIQMPGPGDTILGRHMVSLWGYDDSTSYFTMMNSWGTDYGIKGWFKMPYEYAAGKILESWLLRNVSVTTKK